MKSQTNRIHVFEFDGGKREEFTDEQLDQLNYKSPEDFHFELVVVDLLTCTKIIRATATTGWYGEYR